jgi:hypothetical protein
MRVAPKLEILRRKALKIPEGPDAPGLWMKVLAFGELEWRAYVGCVKWVAPEGERLRPEGPAVGGTASRVSRGLSCPCRQGVLLE